MLAFLVEIDALKTENPAIGNLPATTVCRGRWRFCESSLGLFVGIQGPTEQGGRRHLIPKARQRLATCETLLTLRPAYLVGIGSPQLRRDSRQPEGAVEAV